MKSFSLRRCNSLTAVWIAEEEESEVKLVQLIENQKLIHL